MTGVTISALAATARAKLALAAWDSYQPNISPDGIVRQAHELADAIRALPGLVERVEVLEGALKRALQTYDARAGQCPVDKSPAYRNTPCPTCGALASGSCGVKASASCTFISEVRAALKGDQA